jgi:predicted phosphodiesterase
VKHLEGKGEQIYVKNDLFNWNEIPGNDNSKLTYFLKQNFGIDREREAEITKIDGENTIKVDTGNKTIFLKLNNEKTRVKIEIDDKRSDELIVDSENGKLNLYKKNERTKYERTIIPPSKIVLLGDILDLWDPENSDRSHNIKRGAEPFSLIHETKCDKIYVVGNHDQDLYELADVFEKDKSALNLGDYKLEVFRKHYPLNVIKGIRIGKIRYAFLHGHQFEKVQITELVNKKLGIRFDPIDVVQDISNISIVKTVCIEKRPTVVYIISLGFSVLLWNYMQAQPGLWSIPYALLLSYVVLTPAVKIIAKSQAYIWNKFLEPV